MKQVRSKYQNPWTAQEMKRLRAMAAARMSARLAAKELGRTTGAVKWKAMIERVRFRAINQKPGTQRTPEQRARLSRITAARHRRNRRRARR